jgi:hypothetical protein
MLFSSIPGGTLDLDICHVTTKGLILGSALAPLSATAFTARVPHAAFLVGLAAAVGAGNQYWVL